MIRVGSMNAKTKGAKVVVIKQTVSGAGKGKRQIATLKGLGLNKLNKVSELQDSVAVRGMIAKVKHLVKVVN